MRGSHELDKCLKMCERNRMKKRRNRICRRIAVALTVALLVGQSHAFVLAEEGAGDTQTQTEAPFGEIEAGAPKPEDNKHDGDQQDDEDGQDNTDSNPEENTNEPERCVCETACTEEAINADCPVCAADYANCAKNAGEGVNPTEGAAVSEDEGIATLADEEEITYAGMKYVVTSDGKVKVGRQDTNAINGNIEIPKEFDYEKDGVTYHYEVTEIGEYAFQTCNGLTDITISKGVTSIGDLAFSACMNLTNVTIPESVSSIGDGAFAACMNLTNVTIPKSVTIIGENTFNSCSSLTKIIIPKGVTIIEDVAFISCSSLTEMTISDSVEIIDYEAFKDCSNLKTLNITISDISSSIPVWNSAVFDGCTSRNEVVF